jgi:formate hydrogenlyase transcriptional activator
MTTSSMLPDHSLDSQESPTVRPELQRESDRLKLLLDMTATLVSTLESRELLRTVSASIRQVMHCDIVAVWLPDAEQVHLSQTAMDFPESKGFAKEDALRPIDGSAVGTAFKAGKPIVLDLSREQLAPYVSSHVRAEGLESGCALPLISRGRTLGVLTLGSRTKNSISPEDVDFLLRAAGQLAIAIENRLAYREVAELKDKLAQENCIWKVKSVGR